MSDNVRLLWKYPTGGDVVGVAVDSEGQFVAAVSDDGYLYALDREGNLNFKVQVAQKDAYRVAISDNGQRIAASSRSGRDVVYLERSGRLIWRQTTESVGWAGVSMVADGSLVCSGNNKGIVRLWNQAGQEQWLYSSGLLVRSVALPFDGAEALIAVEDGKVFLLDSAGRKIWQTQLDGDAWPGARMSPDGEVIAAGAASTLYLLNPEGHILSRYPARSTITAVAVSRTGRHIAVGSSDRHVYLLDPGGNLLWKQATGATVYCVAQSADSDFIVAASYDHFVYLFDRAGEVLGRYETKDEAYWAAITPDGRFFAAGSQDDRVYFYKNLSAPPAARPPDPLTLTTARAISQVRQAYAQNPFLGLGHWFVIFQRHLLRGRFGVCEQLLEEIRAGGYQLAPVARDYIDSREGVLRLRQGIVEQRRLAYESAKRHYRASLAIQERLRHLPSQGEVREALDLLVEEQETGQRDPHLEEFARTPMALGSVEALLIHQFENGDAKRRHLVTEAAYELRLIGALLKFASAGNPGSRMLAVAALARLKGAQATEGLLAVIDDPNWFVRWRALSGLVDEPDAARPQVDRLGDALARERDPEVRRSLALVLRAAGDRRATSALVDALLDTDNDVCLAAIQALGRVGDRRALTTLRRVPAKTASLGQSLPGEAAAAIKMIEERHPAPIADAFRACLYLEKEKRLVVTDFFRPGEAPIFAAALSRAKPDTVLQLVVKRGDLGRWQHETTYAQVRAQAAALQSGLLPPVEPLVEFIDGVPAPLDGRDLAIGEQVSCIKAGAGGRNSVLVVGDRGTIRSITPSQDLPIGVEWDRDVGGHDGRSKFKCPPGHGWFVKEEDVELYLRNGADYLLNAGSILLGAEQADEIARLLAPGSYRAILQWRDPESGGVEVLSEARFQLSD